MNVYRAEAHRLERYASARGWLGEYHCHCLTSKRLKRFISIVESGLGDACVS